MSGQKAMPSNRPLSELLGEGGRGREMEERKIPEINRTTCQNYEIDTNLTQTIEDSRRIFLEQIIHGRTPHSSLLTPTLLPAGTQILRLP